MRTPLPTDYSNQIKSLREKLGLTQIELSERLGVSFASVNRWENGKSRPTSLAWERLIRAETHGLEALDAKWSAPVAISEERAFRASRQELKTDFSSHSDVVRAVVEGQRLGYAHLCNPAFAAEMSLVDPL